MISAVSEARVSVRMDAIAVLDDLCSGMERVEKRLIEIRKRTAECQRHADSANNEIAKLRTEEQDLHLQLHCMATEAITEKRSLAAANRDECARPTK